MKSKWQGTGMVRGIVAVLGCAAVLLGLSGGIDAKNVEDDPLPWMKVTIRNNDPNYNIYPVLTTGTSKSDDWLRAWFKVTNKDYQDAMKDKKFYYPRSKNYRLYINPAGKGIEKGKSVTLELPLYTQLVKNPDKFSEDQYIEWWSGGHLEIFAAPKGSGPPPELTELYTNRPTQEPANVGAAITETLPKCADCQPLKIFVDSGGNFKSNAPFQLTEYTLGAVDLKVSDLAAYPVLDTFFGAVDIDVSYVDTAALPAVMAPINDKDPKINQVGYVGTPITINKFKAALAKFLKAYPEWPQFQTDKTPKVLVPKIASLLHAFSKDSDVTQPPWKSVQPLIDQYQDCLNKQSAIFTQPLCNTLRIVDDLFERNYEKYKSIFKSTPGCTGDPVKLTIDLKIAHVYGFSPFVENCENFSDKNRLEDTPRKMTNGQLSPEFSVIKQKFDELNYWKGGLFNPYVMFIHDPRYLGAANAYAYSVDDAVGNLQADGNGFIVAVGGTDGLPNPTPASPPVHVNFGAESQAGKWTHYGICTTTEVDKPVNENFLSLSFYIPKDKLQDCPISLKASTNSVMSFKLLSLDFPDGGPTPSLNTKTHAPIDCSLTKDGTVQRRMCCNIFAFKLKSLTKEPDALNVQVPALFSGRKAKNVTNGDELCPSLPKSKKNTSGEEASKR